MKSIIDLVCSVVGLIAGVIAIWQFILFVRYRDPITGAFDMRGGDNHLWMAIGAAVVFCACILVFFLRRVNKEEEIHITQ